MMVFSSPEDHAGAQGIFTNNMFPMKSKHVTTQGLKVLFPFYPDIFQELFKGIDTLGKKFVRKQEKDYEEGYNHVQVGFHRSTRTVI
jgi:hypothetical protein